MTKGGARQDQGRGGEWGRDAARKDTRAHRKSPPPQTRRHDHAHPTSPPRDPAPGRTRAPGTFTPSPLPGYGATARAISPGGTAVGTSDFFTTTKLWPLTGGSLPFPGPQAAEPEDFSSQGRVVGYTYRHSSVNPHRPWTVYQGSTTWLPVPNADLTDNVSGLRVNSCGSIVGTQIFTDGSLRGLMWRKQLVCDLGGTVTDPGTIGGTTVGAATGTLSTNP